MHPSPQSGPRDWPGRQEVYLATGRSTTDGRQLPPTQDPQEALEFCRALASAMDLTATAEDVRQPPDLVAAILRQRAAALPPPMLSIVIPVFNEEENLQTLHARLTRTLTEQGLDYEIVFVDDGSQDRSPEILRRLEEDDQRVVVVEFARNFDTKSRSAPDWSIAAGVSSASWMPICRILPKSSTPF